MTLVTEQWYIDICEAIDAEPFFRVETTLGPYLHESIAERADAGVNRNLNHERFWTMIRAVGPDGKQRVANASIQRTKQLLADTKATDGQQEEADEEADEEAVPTIQTIGRDPQATQGAARPIGGRAARMGDAPQERGGPQTRRQEEARACTARTRRPKTKP